MTFGPFMLKSVEIHGDNLVLNLADLNGNVVHRPKRKLRYRNAEEARSHAESLTGGLVTTETVDPIKWSPEEWWESVSKYTNEKYSPPKSCTKVFGPPGTGKTTTLIDAVMEYIEKGGETHKIAFLTFTNNAADVARDRVIEASKKSFPDRNFSLMDFPHFSTLHSLATKMGGLSGKAVLDYEQLRRFDPEISKDAVWMKLGDPSSVEDRPNSQPLALQSFARARCISLAEAAGQSEFEIQELEEYLRDFFKNQRGQVVTQQGLDLITEYLNEYNCFKSENQLADFDDVIDNAQNDKNFEHILSFDLLIVDEAQDLSDLLWKLVNRLISKANQVIVAGDDDQAIMVPFGASPTAFLKLEGQEKVLNKSWRVPKLVHALVMMHSMPLLKKRYPDRKSKDWLPTDKTGEVHLTVERIVRPASNDGQLSEPTVQKVQLVLADLLGIVKKSQKEEWLIMAPTRSTCKSISDGLRELGVPHYFRNKPILNARNLGSAVRVMTIHTSKGDEADNAALVINPKRDWRMIENDPRLEYVALTRAKKNLYPRVMVIPPISTDVSSRTVMQPWPDAALG